MSENNEKQLSHKRLSLDHWLALSAILLSLIALTFSTWDFFVKRNAELDIRVEPHLAGPVKLIDQISPITIDKPGYQGKLIEFPLHIIVGNNGERPCSCSVDWFAAVVTEPVRGTLIENVPALSSPFFKEFTPKGYQGTIELPINLGGYQQESFYIKVRSLIWDYGEKDDDLFTFFALRRDNSPTLGDLMAFLQKQDMNRVQKTEKKSLKDNTHIMTRPDGLSAVKIVAHGPNVNQAETMYSIHYALYDYYVDEGNIKPTRPILPASF